MKWTKEHDKELVKEMLVERQTAKRISNDRFDMAKNRG